MSMQLFVFTTHLLKDSLILFLSMTSLYIYEKYIEDKKNIYIIALIIFLSFLIMTRIYSGVGLSLGILIDYLVSNNKRFGKIKVFCFILLIIALIIISPLNAHINME